jgi:hypothetical protein
VIAFVVKGLTMAMPRTAVTLSFVGATTGPTAQTKIEVLELSRIIKSSATSEN